eukprot:m.79499 g.79499  ORF g.79499 m.79499 type:complete len:92 (-) comp8184_c0_seq2:125-400(-)
MLWSSFLSQPPAKPLPKMARERAALVVSFVTEAYLITTDALALSFSLVTCHSLPLSALLCGLFFCGRQPRATVGSALFPQHQRDSSLVVCT